MGVDVRGNAVSFYFIDRFTKEVPYRKTGPLTASQRTPTLLCEKEMRRSQYPLFAQNSLAEIHKADEGAQ